jgi:hypothetical protein
MTPRSSASPGKRHRDAKKARAAQGEQQTNRTKREWCPVLDFPPAVATASQASRNTYPTAMTPPQYSSTRLQRLDVVVIERRPQCAT